MTMRDFIDLTDENPPVLDTKLMNVEPWFNSIFF